MTDSSRSTGARTETISLGSACALVGGELVPGSVVAGRYEVRRRVASGGFGVVYEALDRASGEPVALKALRSDRWSEAALHLFRREAELVRGLVHPRLARVHRSGSRGASVYLVMERAPGVPLAARLADGPLPVREAAEIAAQVAEGLAALHGAGVVHRDVKPDNVLVDRWGRVKLTDFGLARRPRDDDRTADPGGAGTVEYMAPEDVLGDGVDERADLYSLGALLHQMLTGRPPHVGGSTVATLLSRLRDSASDVRRVRPEVPESLAATVSRLLARDPDDRPLSAREVLAALEPHRSSRLRRAALSLISRSGGRRFRIAASLVAFLLAASAFAVHELRPETRFREVAHQPTGLSGIGPDGEVLWELPDRVGALTLARLHPDEPPRLVGVVRPPEGYDPEHTRRLSILDPESGLTVGELNLIDGSGQFSSFADRYSVQTIEAVDLDDDGLDEVVLSYHHKPYWPSYTVLYEPRLQRSRLLFFGSGHHRYAGAVDLDGDGAREILLTGINNRFGFTRAVAAVRPVPAVNQPGESVLANSPDDVPFQGERALVWYALLPPGSSGDLQWLASTDPRDRVLRFSGPSGGSVRLSYDGFLETGRSPRTAEERQRARRRAFAALREANRLVLGGWSDEGLAEMERSVAAARRSGDSVLEEHMLRMRGRLLARAGRAEEAEAVFEQVISVAPRSSSVAFDAGRAFHLAGELERAVRWYRRGFGPEGSSTRGRSQWELVEGLVFALDELGRREEARREFDRFAAARASERGGTYDQHAIYRAYLCWRDGHLPTKRFRLGGLQQTDVSRYLTLELRRAQGEPAPELLLAVDEELRRSSDTLPMLLSLRAELLADRGRGEEAVVSIREALDGIERPIDDEIYGRAFRWLVEERAERLGVLTEKEG